MTTITIYVEADRGFSPALGRRADTTIGLVLAVGATKVPNRSRRVRAVFDQILQPWTWHRPDMVPNRPGVAFPDAKTLDGYSELPSEGCWLEAGLANVREHLAMTYYCFSGNDRCQILDSGGQSYALDGAQADATLDGMDTPNVVTWPGVLSDVAKTPGALGRGLGLLYGFSSSVSTLVSSALCPSFKIFWLEDKAEKSVTLARVSDTAEDGGFEYGFDGDDEEELGAAITVRCLVRFDATPSELVCPKAVVDPIVNPRTGWVQLPKRVPIGTRDFIAEFPADVQSALDLPDLFIVSTSELLHAWHKSIMRQRDGEELENDRPDRPPLPLSVPKGPTGSFADLMAKVFVRLIGPMFALGIPPLSSNTDVFSRQDWVRKSLLFDAVRGVDEGDAAQKLLELLGPEHPTLEEPLAAYASAILATAEGFDRIYEPDEATSSSPGEPDHGSRLSELVTSLLPLAAEFNATADFAALKTWIERDSAAGGGGAEGPDTMPEAVGSAVEGAIDRLAALRRISATMRTDDFHRRAVDILFREVGEVPDGFQAIGVALQSWAVNPAEGAAAKSQTAGRALRDRLRRLIETRGVLPLSLADWFRSLFQRNATISERLMAAFGHDLSDVTETSAGALGGARTAVKQAGLLAITRAISPYLDPNETVEGETSFESNALVAIAGTLARAVVARADRMIGASGEVGEAYAVRLEPPILCERPEPLVVPVGKIAMETEPDPSKSTAYAGFGVLVRRNTEKELQDWHSLTVGMPRFVSKTENHMTLVGVGHAPVRIVEQSDLASWLMVYDGAPLSALPLRYDPREVPSFDYLRSSDENAERNRIVIAQPDKEAFEACSGELDATAECRACALEKRLFELVALKYGETLEFAFFVQKNNGFLPIEVASEADPALFRLPSTKAVPGGRPCNGFTHSLRIRHLRRTAVSIPRLVGNIVQRDPEAFNRAFSAFEPRNVDRERIQPLTDLAIDSPSREHGRVGQQTPRERIGLILLAPKRSAEDKVDWTWDSSFSFNLLPPATTIADYERWRFKDLIDAKSDTARATIRNEIIAVLSAYDEATARLSRNQPPRGDDVRREGGEVSPDDPAVVGIGLRLSEVRLKDPTDGAVPYQIDIVDAKVIKLVQPEAPAPGGNRDPLAAKVLKRPVRVTVEAGSDELAVPARIDLRTREAAAADGADVVITVAAGRMYQLDIVSLALQVHYGNPADTGNGARFRAGPGALLTAPLASDIAAAGAASSPVAWVPAPLSADFGGYVEASRTTLDVEVATAVMPKKQALFDTIDLIGEEDGDLLVGFVPPDDPIGASAFRYVAEAVLSRQRWRWTGRTSGRLGSTEVEGEDRVDLREISQRVWQRTAGFLLSEGAFSRRGMRAIGRAVLEPAYVHIESAEEAERPGSAAVKEWRNLILTDGEWFGATSDANRFEEIGAWPTLTPRRSYFADASGAIDERRALRNRGLALARVPVATRPQAQYWRFGAVAISRYRAMMSRRPSSEETLGQTSAPWRRVILAPGQFEEAAVPAPRLRIMIPLPAPIASAADGRDDDDGWASFLAVFDEAWGEVGGLAEFIEPEVALTTDSDESVNADTNALTAIFRPCYEIPEFGFDPIMRASNVLAESGMSLQTDAINGCVETGKGRRDALLKSGGALIGLTFDETLDAAPARTMIEVRLDATAAPAIKGAEGDRIFAEAFFRRAIRRWSPAADGSEDVLRSQRTRLEWILFGASNGVWRMRLSPADDLRWVHVASLRFDVRNLVFHATTPEGFSQGKVNLYATNASMPPTDAPRTTLVRRLGVILTNATRGASGDQRSEVFLGAGMVAELTLDAGQTIERSFGMEKSAPEPIDNAYDETKLRKPFFWFEQHPPENGEILARLVELEFHAEHRDYRQRAIEIKGRKKRFFVERQLTSMASQAGAREPHDHPIFDAILGVVEGDGGRQDARARVSRISPPIAMLPEKPS